MLTPKLVICLQEGYSRKRFVQDTLAGVTVGIIAIPLAMAFAIASGVTPERGLYTAIVGGLLISLFGGSRVQIGGPTGAFVVILYGIVQKHGYDGLAIATFMAGVMLILMGFLRLGAAITFIPYPVITGFTAGIAVIIFSSQVKDFLGLTIPQPPADFLAKWQSYCLHLSSFTPSALLIASISLAALIVLRRVSPRVPAPLVVIVGAGLASYWLHLPVETIGSRFGDMPRSLPPLHLPSLPFSKIQLLLPDAFTIALLGAIEALLSAVVADGMTGYRHKSNTELLAQGIANVFSVLFGGIAATGAIARTATNIKSGAQTPIAGIIHALTILLCLWWFAPYARHIPLAALSAILVMVAWNMSEVHHFIRLLHAPRSDAAILLLTFFLTMLADLTTAVAVGTILSTLLFIQRLSSFTRVDIVEESTPLPEYSHLPPHIAVFDMNGPFFFGSADRLRSAFSRIHGKPSCLILRLRHVPMLDSTGLHALEQFLSDCTRSKITLCFCDVPEAILPLLARSGFGSIYSTLEEALAAHRA